MKTNTNPRITVGMWIVAFVFAIAALMGGLRVYGTISQREFLLALSETINIPYLIISGAITFFCGLVGVGSIFLRQFWVPKATMISTTVLSLQYWFDQFVFVENTNYIQIAWGFSLMINVLLIGLLAWVLTRKRVQAYYQGSAAE